jgi:hypothetical protein
VYKMKEQTIVSMYQCINISIISIDRSLLDNGVSIYSVCI